MRLGKIYIESGSMQCRVQPVFTPIEIRKVHLFKKKKKTYAFACWSVKKPLKEQETHCPYPPAILKNALGHVLKTVIHK